MDAVILAGGKGTRMLPLTENTPKPLLKVQGKSILEWTLLNLPDVVDRVLVVVGYRKDDIAVFMREQPHFSDYVLVEQLPRPMGTGHAIACCAPHLHSQQFLVLNGDDLFSPAGLKQLADTPLGILTVYKEDPTEYGVVVSDSSGHLTRLHEKPPRRTYPPPVKVNIGAYKLSKAIFDYELPLSARGEYEITDYLMWLADHDPVEVVLTDFWMPIGNPGNLEDAQHVTLPFGPGG